MNENEAKGIEMNKKTNEYEGVLHAIDRLNPQDKQHADLAYLASQVELANIPHEAKRPFYAAIEACYRETTSNEEHRGLAKLADFYAGKLKAEKT